MKTKLLSAVAACVLALNVGSANASTFQVSGLFTDFVGLVFACVACPGVPLSQFTFPPGVQFPEPTVNGTLTFASGALTNINLTVDPGTTYTSLNGGPGQTTFSSNVSPNEQSWTVSINTIAPFGLSSFFISILDLTLTNTAGQLTGSLHEVAQPGRIGFEAYVGTYTTLLGTVGIVPVPAALPLFATGLGVLGLLGWRRKRKAQAAAA